MKQLDTRLFVIYSLDDVTLLSLNDTINKNNILLIVPGILDTDVVDTEYKQIADLAIQYSKETTWNIVIIHNESHGMISDLLEAATGKLFGGLSDLFGAPPEYPGRMLESILEDRPSNKETVIMCHSQGGIISSNAVNCCNKYVRAKVKINFFGSAAWTLPHIRRENMAEYTTDLDPVALFFGRGFCPSTIKCRKTLWHGIPHYRPIMELVLQHIFGLLSDSDFEETIKNV